MRIARVAKSVENIGGIVRVLGYISMALGVIFGFIIVIAASSTRGTTSSLVASGIGSGLTVVIAGFVWGLPLVLIGGYAQMRSLTVQADAARREIDGLEAFTVAGSPGSAPASSPGAIPASAMPGAAPGPMSELPGKEKVSFLTDPEKARLSAMPPADQAPGWFADPLGKAVQRYWNGTQWTGRMHD